jgi:signal transduction histidine kinase
VLSDRFRPAVEATAYFVVSEALTNAVKHSGAHRAQVAAHVDNGALQVEIRDNGVGGADPSQGSGLTGLRDRVEALGGTIEITSPAGSGTSLVAEIRSRRGRVHGPDGAGRHKPAPPDEIAPSQLCAE